MLLVTIDRVISVVFLAWRFNQMFRGLDPNSFRPPDLWSPVHFNGSSYGTTTYSTSMASFSIKSLFSSHFLRTNIIPEETILPDSEPLNIFDYRQPSFSPGSLFYAFHCVGDAPVTSSTLANINMAFSGMVSSLKDSVVLVVHDASVPVERLNVFMHTLVAKVTERFTPTAMNIKEHATVLVYQMLTPRARDLACDLAVRIFVLGLMAISTAISLFLIELAYAAFTEPIEQHSTRTASLNSPKCIHVKNDILADNNKPIIDDIETSLTPVSRKMNPNHIPLTVNTDMKVGFSPLKATSPTSFVNSTPTTTKTSNDGNGSVLATLVASPGICEGSHVLSPVNGVKGFEADETPAKPFTNMVEETKATHLLETDSQIGLEVVQEPTIVVANDCAELIASGSPSADVYDNIDKRPNESCPPSDATCETNQDFADAPGSNGHDELEASLVNGINSVITSNQEMASGQEEHQLITPFGTPEARHDDIEDKLVEQCNNNAQDRTEVTSEEPSTWCESLAKVELPSHCNTIEYQHTYPSPSFIDFNGGLDICTRDDSSLFSEEDCSIVVKIPNSNGKEYAHPTGASSSFIESVAEQTVAMPLTTSKAHMDDEISLKVMASHMEPYSFDNLSELFCKPTIPLAIDTDYETPSQASQLDEDTLLASCTDKDTVETEPIMEAIKVDETALASSDQDSQATQLDENTSPVSGSDEDHTETDLTIRAMKVDETATASSDQDSQATQLDENTSPVSGSDEDHTETDLTIRAMKVDETATASSDQDSQANQLDENTSPVSGSDEDHTETDLTIRAMKVDETATASSDQDSQANQLDENTLLVSSSDEDGTNVYDDSTPLAAAEDKEEKMSISIVNHDTNAFEDSPMSSTAISTADDNAPSVAVDLSSDDSGNGPQYSQNDPESAHPSSNSSMHSAPASTSSEVGTTEQDASSIQHGESLVTDPQEEPKPPRRKRAGQGNRRRLALLRERERTEQSEPSATTS